MSQAQSGPAVPPFEIWDGPFTTGITTDNDQLSFSVLGDQKVLITDANGFVNGSTPMTINIGGSSTLQSQWLIRKNDSDLSIGIGTLAHSDTAGRGGVIFGGKTRGTETSPTATQDGDTLFDYAAVGHDGTDFNLAGRLSFYQNGAGAVGSTPGGMTFNFTKPGDNNVTEFADLSHEGIVVNDNSEAFGYRFETITDEYALYNDSSTDTWAMGTSITSFTANGATVRPKLLVDRGGGDSNINFVSFSNQDAASAGAFMVAARARGYSTSPTTLQAVQNGDRGFVFRSDMHDGTEFITNGLIQYIVNGTVSRGIVPVDCQVNVTDSTGTLYLHTVMRGNGQFGMFPVGGDSHTFYEEGGWRGNRNQESSALADLIYASSNYTQPFRIDVSADEINFGNNSQGALCSMEASTLTARFNRSNAGANIVVESSSAGINLWETDTTNDLIDHNGGLRVKTRRITSGPDNIGVDDYTLYYDTDGGAITANLPAGSDGQTYRIINCGSSGNDVTLTPNGSEQIRGSGAGTSVTLGDGDVLIITFQTTEHWW